MHVRWDEKNRHLWLIRNHSELEEKLDAKYSRVSPGALRWIVPPDGVITLDRVFSIAKAKLSGALAPDDPLVAARVAACTGCDALKQKSWCGACGCGPRKPMLTPEGGPAKKMLLRGTACPKLLF